MRQITNKTQITISFESNRELKRITFQGENYRAAIKAVKTIYGNVSITLLIDSNPKQITRE